MLIYHSNLSQHERFVLIVILKKNSKVYFERDDYDDSYQSGKYGKNLENISPHNSLHTWQTFDVIRIRWLIILREK